MKQFLTVILTFIILHRLLTPVILIAQVPQRSGHRGLFNTPIDPADMAIDHPAESTTSPSAITLTSFDDPDPTESNAFPIGVSQEELVRWFGGFSTFFTAYDNQGNPYDIMPGDWSFDQVDTHTPGVYYAVLQPELDDLYVLAPGVSLPQQLYVISIQIPGQLEINSFSPSRGAIRFPWVLSQAQLDQFEALRQIEQLGTFATVWLREDNKQWVALSDDCFFVADALNLPDHFLTYGSNYDLQVDYPGGQTGIVTFQFTSPLNFIRYSEGDRDGGDVGGGDSSTGSQPAPSLPEPPRDFPEDAPFDSDLLPPPQDHEAPGPNKTPVEEDIASLPNKLPIEDNSISIPDSTADESSITLEKPPRVEPAALPNNINTNKPSFLEQPFFTAFIDLVKSVPTNRDLSSSYESNDPSPPVDVQIPGGVQVAGNSNTLPNLFLDLGDPKPVAVPKLLPKAPKITKAAKVTKAPVAPKVVKVPKSPEPPFIIQESYSPGHTVISALRLRDLCADEDSVVFGSGNLTVSIPSKLLMALNLTDYDFLSVRLTELEDHQISLAIEVSGKAITQIPGTVLRMRYRPESEDPQIIVRNERSHEITDTTFDDGVLHFTVNTDGTYRISELPSSLDVQKAVSPELSLPIIMILTAGGILLFRRKQNG